MAINRLKFIKISIGTFLTLIIILYMISLINTPDNSEKPFEISIFENWNDLIENRRLAIRTLPTYTDFLENATTWEDYANKAFNDLLVYNSSWTYAEDNQDNITGFRPYVSGTDGYGGKDKVRNITELMAGMDVLWPMYRYLQLHPNSTRETMVNVFIQELPKYFSSTVNQSTNRPGETMHDTWYFMENSVLKYGHLYLISNITELKMPYWGSLFSGLQVAKNFDYLLPQFIKLHLEKKHDYYQANNPAFGLLAYSLIHAFELSNDTNFLKEAEYGLLKMRSIEPYKLIYEPQELAAAVAAAALLIKYADLLQTDTDFSYLAQDFFYAQQQLLYYDNGKINLPHFFILKEHAWRDGLNVPYYNWNEKSGINAPAFKESVESVMFWVDYLKNIYFDQSFSAEEPLKILNLNRIKTFNFFSPNIPDTEEHEWGPTTLQYIPYEDIDWNYLKPGQNGKEIYGAGETLWNYLMFEALGISSDRNALILNLNMFEKNYPVAVENRSYIIWNPYEIEKKLTFTIRHTTGSYPLYVNGSLYDSESGDTFSIVLGGRNSAYLTFKEGMTPPVIERSSPRIISVPVKSTVSKSPDIDESLPNEFLSIRISPSSTFESAPNSGSFRYLVVLMAIPITNLPATQLATVTKEKMFA